MPMVDWKGKKNREVTGKITIYFFLFTGGCVCVLVRRLCFLLESNHCFGNVVIEF